MNLEPTGDRTMAAESGRPNEFESDSHFWPEDPSAEQLKAWTPAYKRSTRVFYKDETVTCYIDGNGKKTVVATEKKK